MFGSRKIKIIPKVWKLKFSIEEKNVFFSEQANYLYDSFETISSTGKNGAIIHYKYLIWINKYFIYFCWRPTKESDTKISENELYLVDSGGQYK
jgi:Xaa-Pro aminopeptidase